MKIRLLTTALLLLSASSVLAADWADARTNTPTTALPPAPAPAAQTASTSAPAAPPVQSEPATDITAPLRQTPPAPLSAAEAWSISQAAPLNRGEIENVSRAVDDASRGRAWQPADVVPRISTLTVNLSPGASLPVLRTATHQASTVMFTDNTGAPWPLAAPPYNANDKGFSVSYIPDSSVMTVQATRQYDRGNITVYLKGLAVPIIVDVTSGEATNATTSRVIDTRLDLRIPQRGPQAKKMAAPQSKIGLNDPTLQAFLDGVPPKDAHRLKTEGAVPDTQVWQMGDDLFIRTRSELRDEFEQTLASGDGTWLYKLPLTPEVAFSHAGQTVWMTLALE